MPPTQIMAPADSSDHHRTYNLLLVSRVLALRDDPSPFTLLLDTLSQSGRPLVQEFISRSAGKRKVVVVSYETFQAPLVGIDAIVCARRKTISELQEKIAAVLSTGIRTLVIIDALNVLCASRPASLLPFLSSLMSPTTCILATYHIDVPLSLPARVSVDTYPENAPHPLTLLKYFSTTLISVHSFKHILAAKAARDKSLAPPVWGLDEDADGIVIGLGSNPHEGLVLEMEYRRKSGRGIRELYFLPISSGDRVGGGGTVLEKERAILLEDHPLWRLSEVVKQQESQLEKKEDAMPQSTFELSITERQKKVRDEVVLPYFDAQQEGSIGRGGAILFIPDKNIDDFDDEEDEI